MNLISQTYRFPELAHLVRTRWPLIASMACVGRRGGVGGGEGVVAGLDGNAVCSLPASVYDRSS